MRTATWIALILLIVGGVNWLLGKPKAQTSVSHFAALVAGF
jgi:hypothetical protein